MLQSDPQPLSQVKSLFPSGFFPGTHWYEVGSPGLPTLLLVHGYMAHAMAFRRVVADLSRHFHLVVVDLPGHGLDETYLHGLEPGIEALRDWLDEIVVALTQMYGPIHVIGHSLGALILGITEHQHQGKVVLASPGLRLPSVNFAPAILDRAPGRLNVLLASRLALRLYEPIQWRGKRMTPEEARAYLHPFKDPERVQFMLRLGADLLRTPDRAEQVRQQSSMMLMWGEKDHLLPLRDAISLRDSLSGVEFAVLARAGHALMEDQPQAFTDHVLEFLLDTEHSTK